MKNWFKKHRGLKDNSTTRIVKINVINEKKLVNNKGKVFHVVEVKPEIIFILDEDNNFVTHYCGSINDDEDNMKIINQM